VASANGDFLLKKKFLRDVHVTLTSRASANGEYPTFEDLSQRRYVA
jgi:hypothetical protein